MNDLTDMWAYKKRPGQFGVYHLVLDCGQCTEKLISTAGKGKISIPFHTTLSTIWNMKFILTLPLTNEFFVRF